MRRRLWRCNDGMLLVGERLDPVRFVLDAETGEPVLPVAGDVLLEDAVTLHMPDEEPDSAHVLARPVEIDPARHAASDRYAAYFGKPGHSRWALLDIESVKCAGLVIDGAELGNANTLRGEETAICRELNADGPGLGAVCRRETGVAVAEPVAVGVDLFGIVVRARFGVVRVEFAGEARDAPAARREIQALLRKGGP